MAHWALNINTHRHTHTFFTRLRVRPRIAITGKCVHVRHTYMVLYVGIVFSAGALNNPTRALRATIKLGSRFCARDFA